jgi:hypothetical protein
MYLLLICSESFAHAAFCQLAYSLWSRRVGTACEEAVVPPARICEAACRRPFFPSPPPTSCSIVTLHPALACSGALPLYLDYFCPVAIRLLPFGFGFGFGLSETGSLCWPQTCVRSDFFFSIFLCFFRAFRAFNLSICSDVRFALR